MSRKIKKEEDLRDYMIYSDSIDQKYKPDSIVFHRYFVRFLIFVIIALDAAILVAFAVANRVPPGFSLVGASGAGLIGGLILLLDCTLPFAIMALKRRRCGLDVSQKTVIVSALSIVLLFVACIFWIRITLVPPEARMLHVPADILASLPPDSPTVPQAIIFGLLPLATSITGIILVGLTYDPLKIKMQFFEQKIFSESEKLMSVNAELAKYNLDMGDYITRIFEEEHRRYQNKMLEIRAMEVDLKAYFRRRLAETLAQPDSASILSALDYTPYVERVEMMEIPESIIEMLKERGEKSA